jgi:hypothetical protein
MSRQTSRISIESGLTLSPRQRASTYASRASTDGQRDSPTQGVSAFGLKASTNRLGSASTENLRYVSMQI